MQRYLLLFAIVATIFGWSADEKAVYQVTGDLGDSIDVVLAPTSLFVLNEAGEIWRVGRQPQSSIPEKLAEGLLEPAGLAHHDGMLYAACKGYVAEISVAGGQVTQIPVHAAQLVGITVGPSGEIYVSDRAANRIYRIQNRQVQTFKRGPSLHQPNGLACLYEQLYIACQGGSEVMGAIRVMPLEPEADNNLWSEPMGRLYGLAGDGDFGFFVSDHVKGVIFHVHADGTTRRLFRVPEPKGLAYDADAQLLWIASPKGLSAYKAKP